MDIGGSSYTGSTVVFTHMYHFQYTLETFGEGRTTKLAHEPYIGGDVDGPNKGVCPAPWSIICVPDIYFFNHTKTIEVPHTSSIKVKCTFCQVQKL